MLQFIIEVLIILHWHLNYTEIFKLAFQLLYSLFTGIVIESATKISNIHFVYWFTSFMIARTDLFAQLVDELIIEAPAFKELSNRD